MTTARSRVLFGVAPTDPLAIGAATALLLAVALLAAYPPARRASLINPTARFVTSSGLHHDRLHRLAGPTHDVFVGAREGTAGGSMGLLDEMKGLLTQYASGATPSGDVSTHFQQVAQSVDSGTLAQGIATAMRSDQTPPFAQIVSQLFSSGSADQKTAMLNTLLSAVSPEQRAHLASLIPGLGSAGVTAAQAATLPADAVQSIAQHVEQHEPGIVDKMSALYAAHPTLIKALGAAAMMIAMRKIAQGHS